MKELSIEEKAKRYDEAIKKAEPLYKTAEHMSGCNVIIETLFPELVESEDEKVKNIIKTSLDIYFDGKLSENTNDVDYAMCLSWLEKQDKKDEEIILLKDKIESLESARIAMQECHRLELEKLEKQGEQKPVFEMKTPEESLGIDSDTYSKIVDECIYGEQKPVELYPIFRIGDIIERKDGQGTHLMITSIPGNFYHCIKMIYSEDDTQFCDIPFKNQDIFRISSDFEQKPADKVEPKFNIGDKIIGIISGMQYYITEVRDDCYYTESGCIIMFCAQNNFELVEQNPAWSEEDNQYVEDTLALLNFGCSIHSIDKVHDWLKSLKDRVHLEAK